MRNLGLAMACLCGLAIAGAAPAVAEPDYPVCMTGGADSGYDGRSCLFMNYQQCQATASGVGGYCYDNPYLVGQASSAARAEQPLAPPRHRSRRMH